MQGSIFSNEKTDLQCALSKILANLLKNDTVQYNDKRKYEGKWGNYWNQRNNEHAMIISSKFLP